MRSCVGAALVEDSSWWVKSLHSDVLNDASSVQPSMLGLKLASSLTKGCYGSAHICAKMIYHPQPRILCAWKMAFGHFTPAERCCGYVCQWCHELPLGLQARHRIALRLSFSAYKKVVVGEHYPSLLTCYICSDSSATGQGLPLARIAWRV